MIRSKLAKKILALLVGTVMVTSMAACAGKTTQDNSAASTAQTSSVAQSGSNEQSAQEPTTIRMLVQGTGNTWNNFHESPVQKDILEKTGVVLEFVEADNDKFKVLLAGGDLPDIIRTDISYSKQLIEGGNIIPMDDLLQSNGQNILKTIPKSVAFSKQFWSENQNKTYFIAAQVGLDSAGAEHTLGAVVRWDYYKELGYPEIKSEDDLLNVLAEMAKKHPTTDDGKKVYGVSAWADWGNWADVYPMVSLYGYNQVAGVEAIKVDTNEITSMMTDVNAPFWKTVSLYYKANKLGILDPDALTMKYDDYMAKATAGQILYGPTTWAMGDFNSNNAKDGKGFMVLPLDWGYQWNGVMDYVGWTDKAFAITKNSENPTKAMDLMNYLWSYDGARTLYSGVKGVNWDIENGQPKLKPETIQLKAAGGPDWENTGIQNDLNLIGLSPFTKHPDDGAPLSLFETEEGYSAALNTLQKDFSDHYGVKYPTEIFNQKLAEGKVKNQADKNAMASALMPGAPDDIKRIVAKLNDDSVKAAAKCILSKSDAEFEANQKKAIEEFKAAGSDKVAEWYTTTWNDAVAKSKSIK